MKHYALRYAAGAMAALGSIVALGLVAGSSRVHADTTDTEESKIQEGFAIAPVPLNLAGKNHDLVGLGSYIVNAQVGCNGCHNPGPGDNEYLVGGNPYFGQPVRINPATYLGGGRDFGAFVPGSAHIISRNLTPDKTGLPEGGNTYQQFVQIIKTGIDLDLLHPTCLPNTINTGCLPAPFDGALLQIMPWPALHNLTDHDLQAIYEYLKAIPCVAGPPAPSPLHHDCQ